MYSGLGVSKGVAQGRLCLCKGSIGTYEKGNIQNTAREKEYVRQAFQSTQEELANLYELAKEKVGITVALIVQGHRRMAEDKGCFEQIVSMIESERANAEWATQQVMDNYIRLMRASEDIYLRARAADFEDLLNRVERKLATVKGTSSRNVEPNEFTEKFLAIGNQMSVEDILSLYVKGAVGILDLSGEEESHALVVAKSLDLPMIIQADKECLNLVGQYCTMDGASGGVEAE